MAACSSSGRKRRHHLDRKSHSWRASAGGSKICLSCGRGWSCRRRHVNGGGEYVSVSSQSDTEHADLAREARELVEDPNFEKEELAQIYVARGVAVGLARQVAQPLMAKDALSALP